MTQTEIKCDDCGEKSTVPFKPTKGRPVYCKSCFEKRKNAPKGSNATKKQRWDRSDYHGYDPQKHATDQQAS